ISRVLIEGEGVVEEARRRLVGGWRRRADGRRWHGESLRQKDSVPGHMSDQDVPEKMTLVNNLSHHSKGPPSFLLEPMGDRLAGFQGGFSGVKVPLASQG